MTAVIRDFRPEDGGQFLSLVRDLQIFEIGIHDRMMPVEDIGEWYIDKLLERCAAEKGSLLVTERGGELIGYAAVFTMVHQTGEIDEVPY